MAGDRGHAVELRDDNDQVPGGIAVRYCGTEYAAAEVTYTCPKDGGNLDIVLDFEMLRSKYQPSDILSRLRSIPLALPASAAGC